jgi:hypothetical protein
MLYERRDILNTVLTYMYYMKDNIYASILSINLVNSCFCLYPH